MRSFPGSIDSGPECRVSGGDLEQIQLLLGHASVQTTERYLGTQQNLVQAVNDYLPVAPELARKFPERKPVYAQAKKQSSQPNQAGDRNVSREQLSNYPFRLQDVQPNEPTEERPEPGRVNS